MREDGYFSSLYTFYVVDIHVPYFPKVLGQIGQDKQLIPGSKAAEGNAWRGLFVTHSSNSCNPCHAK